MAGVPLLLTWTACCLVGTPVPSREHSQLCVGSRSNPLPHPLLRLISCRMLSCPVLSCALTPLLRPGEGASGGSGRKSLHPAVRKLCGGRGSGADEEGVKAMLRSIGRWVGGVYVGVGMYACGCMCVQKHGCVYINVGVYVHTPIVCLQYVSGKFRPHTWSGRIWATERQRRHVVCVWRWHSNKVVSGQVQGR